MLGFRPATLVLQKFSIAVEPQATPAPIVEIVGRRHGLIAFVLGLLGLSPITRLVIAGSELRCHSASLFRQTTQFIPLRCVTQMAAGISRPISYLVWAAILLYFAMYFAAERFEFHELAAGFALLFCMACVAMYFLKKRFFIEIYVAGGPSLSLSFTPNVLEGVPIDIKRALAVIEVMRDMILAEGAASVAPPPSPLTLPHPPHVPATMAADPDPIWMQEPEPDGGDDETRARHLYSTARHLARDRQKKQAVSMLHEVVRRFPHTETAERARRALEKNGIVP